MSVGLGKELSKELAMDKYIGEEKLVEYTE